MPTTTEYRMADFVDDYEERVLMEHRRSTDDMIEEIKSRALEEPDSTLTITVPAEDTFENQDLTFMFTTTTAEEGIEVAYSGVHDA